MVPNLHHEYYTVTTSVLQCTACACNHVQFWQEKAEVLCMRRRPENASLFWTTQAQRLWSL
eukprot:1407699-Amphidinium_carterae.1